MPYFDNYYSNVASNPMDRNVETIDFEAPQPTAPLVIEPKTVYPGGIERYDISDVDKITGLNFSPDFGVKVSEIGISTHPGKDQLEGLKSRIFQGASMVELGFMGRGKGSMQGGNTTPGMFSGEERRDMRELARLNKIQLSTHAGLHSDSLAGMDMREGRFNELAREKTLHEIKRAIDFSADTTEGGAVVFHVHEYERPLGEYYSKEGFKAFPMEPNKAQYYLVNERTGHITTVRKDMFIHEPVFHTNGKGEWLDIDGDVIPRDAPSIDLLRRVPILDPVTKQYQTVRRDWDYFVQRADEWNKMHPESPKKPEEFFVRINLLNQAIQSRGASAFYQHFVEPEIEKTRENLQKALEYFKKIEKNTPLEQQWRIMQEIGSRYAIPGLIPRERKLPSEIIERQLDEIEGSLRHQRTASPMADVQAAQLEQEIEYTVPVEKYASKKTSDTIARAGIYAMKKTEAMQAAPYNKGREIQPMYAAVENAWMPEVYGAHPQELKKIILDARKDMVDKLVEQGYEENTAQQKAEEHIKATIDIGHANTWRKYFLGDPKKSTDDNDKAFKKWLIDQMQDLIDHKLIGHLHINDNFGYEDEHLVPGWGNAPINEFIERVKKLHPTIVVEPSHTDYRSVLGGWKRFGQSIYGLPSRGADTWADVEHSYFGRPAPPYFLFGDAAPNPEQWQLWSGVRME